MLGIEELEERLAGHHRNGKLVASVALSPGILDELRAVVDATRFALARGGAFASRISPAERDRAASA